MSKEDGPIIGDLESNHSKAMGYKALLLGGLVVTGLALSLWQPFSFSELMEIGHRLADYPLSLPIVIILQVVLLAFALPGTAIIWVVAPFYHPLTATLALTVGTTLGALAAYLLSRWLGSTWRLGGRSGRMMDLLAKQGDPLTLIALRVFPGFPHSVVNYSAGALGLPIPTFLLSTLVGVSIKWGVYAYAINALVQTSLDYEKPSLNTLAPLIALTAILLLGRVAKTRFTHPGH